MLANVGINRNIIFRQVFNWMDDIFDNKYSRLDVASSTLPSIVWGVANFSSSKFANYVYPKNGTLSLRIIFSIPVLHAGTDMYLLDFRTASGVWSLYINSSNQLTASSWTVYSNGVAANPTIAINTYYDVVITWMTAAATRMIVWKVNSWASGYPNMNCKLIEIYNTTLSAAQVENLYSNSSYKSLPQNWLLMSFDTTRGVIEDKTWLRTLTTTLWAGGIRKIGNLYAMFFDWTTTQIWAWADWIWTWDITVSAWVYKTGIVPNSRRIISNGKFDFSTNDTAYQPRTSSDSATYANSTALSYYDSRINASITRNVATSKSSLYINWVLSSTANQSSWTPTAGSTVIIWNSTGGWRNRNWYIAKIKVRASIKTDKEIYEEFSSNRNLFSI